MNSRVSKLSKYISFSGKKAIGHFGSNSKRRFHVFVYFCKFFVLNNITKLTSKLVKLTLFIEIFIESTFVGFLPRLKKEIHTNPSSPSLPSFQVQLFPVFYSKWDLLAWKFDQFLHLLHSIL